MKITGIVFSGNGEGKKFLKMKEYSKKLEKKFGFEPFPGTLNVYISNKDIKKIETIKKKTTYISGFRKNKKLFFGIFAVKCKLKNENCTILFPKKSSYKNSLEIIAEKNLRKKFKIKDEDEIEIEI